MPRSVILHHGHLSRGGRIDTSILPKDGIYKVIAVEKTPRNSQGTTIHVSKELRDELNEIIQRVKKASGNQYTQEDIIARLLCAYEHSEVALWHF